MTLVNLFCGLLNVCCGYSLLGLLPMSLSFVLMHLSHHLCQNQSLSSLKKRICHLDTLLVYARSTAFRKKYIEESFEYSLIKEKTLIKYNKNYY